MFTPAWLEHMCVPTPSDPSSFHLEVMIKMKMDF